VKDAAKKKKDGSNEIRRNFLNNRNICIVFGQSNEGGSGVPYTGVEKCLNFEVIGLKVTWLNIGTD
jgi:hypothetical protein